ncbi:hypothetical protein [Sulfuracidifex tepidarius]|uniref:Stage II sporulation protein M n=1 Tax=Sulfuracidifex tepidarius TaxID=1294262 RepID=A0A510DU85_9CREN|nr:hypothetical protein [Sulfuracidifex tepidarius]BBG23714.1 hypothetical protein IC006_1004 [Sulfuracidifex tepidarius]BBG26465.1 hypothetical protein IC007_0975 [Sulfuracidifex tepidarius]
MHELPVPDYTLLFHIITVNFTFALIIFLVGNKIIQKIIGFTIALYVGEIVFKFGLIVGLIGILPHGPIEFLGFSFIAYAGQKFKTRNNYTKPLIIGCTLLITAAFIESTLSIYIFQNSIRVLKNIP